MGLNRRPLTYKSKSQTTELTNSSNTNVKLQAYIISRFRSVVYRVKKRIRSISLSRFLPNHNSITLCLCYHYIFKSYNNFLQRSSSTNLTGGSRNKRFTFQSTVRQLERRKIAEKLSKEADLKEQQRRTELEAMRRQVYFIYLSIHYYLYFL